MNVMSVGELHAQLAGDIASAVEGEVKAYCEQVLRKHIMRSVYSGGGSQYYNRTYQFLNAVEVTDVHKSGSSVSFKITINSSKMGIASSLGKGFNVHMGFPSRGGGMGANMTGGLAEVLNDGITSRIVPRRKAARFFESATSELDGSLAGKLAGALRARGWEARVI